MQRFDYSKKAEKEFTIASVSPSGQSVCVGSFDCLRIFNWSSRKGAWEESGTKHIQQLYTITALDWKSDGSKLACGTLMGGCELFDCSLKKQLIKNRFELTYTGLSQAIIRDLGGSGKRMALKFRLSKSRIFLFHKIFLKNYILSISTDLRSLSL